MTRRYCITTCLIAEAGCVEDALEYSGFATEHWDLAAGKPLLPCGVTGSVSAWEMDAQMQIGETR